MKRGLIAAIAALTLVPASAAAPSIETASVLVDSLMAGCSGFVVSIRPGHTYVMTAKHCREFSEPNTVTFSDGEVAPVVAFIGAKMHDLLVLEVQTKHYHPAAGIVLTDAPGTRVQTYGRSSEALGAYGEGFIAAPVEMLDYSKWHQRVIPLGCTGCDSGGSGGAVFSDGKVVGVFVAGRESGGVYYMIPSATVLRFIRAVAREENK